MKKIKIFLLLISICLISLNAIGQTYIYDGQGNIIGGSHMRYKPGNSVKLTDSLTNNYFLLDSSHVNITAFNKSGKEIWKTDPYKDSELPEYRTKRPVIVNFEFVTEHWCYGDDLKKGTKTIWINYNNTQAGYINLDNGKFNFCGQD